ncbi:MAG: type II toxin-antitoxin system RelE/ParE family toxin [Bacteroidia bacterium]|nr:type II toxin-antitoxin system RelE/ParE family toxin [Bacteroidia bacterium]
MGYKIISLDNFQREAKRLIKKYPSLVNELYQLEQELSENPAIGKPIGKNCYKIRLAIKSKGKGKSGGARVITCVFVDDTEVYLLSVYDKSEQTDITDKKLKELLNQIE